MYEYLQRSVTATWLNTQMAESNAISLHYERATKPYRCSSTHTPSPSPHMLWFYALILLPVLYSAHSTTIFYDNMSTTTSPKKKCETNIHNGVNCFPCERYGGATSSTSFSAIPIGISCYFSWIHCILFKNLNSSHVFFFFLLQLLGPSPQQACICADTFLSQPI